MAGAHSLWWARRARHWDAISSWSSRAAGPLWRDWLAPAEQALVADAGASERDLLTNLLWTAKEAAAKARREGLRLDPRHAVATPAGIGSTTPGWRRLEVVWSDGGGRAAGWWRCEPDWVMAIAGEPAPGVPRALDAVVIERAPEDGP